MVLINDKKNTRSGLTISIYFTLSGQHSPSHITSMQQFNVNGTKYSRHVNLQFSYKRHLILRHTIVIYNFM